MSAPAKTPLPRLNQRLEVAAEARGSAHHFSKLVEETSEVLRMTMPEMEGRLLDLQEGDTVRVCYTQSGGYWCLHTHVLTVFKKDGITMIDVDRTGSVKRAQRRNHVRVNVSLLLHVEELSKADETEPSATRISGVTRNVSGGGVSFRTKHELKRGDKIQMTFYLPEHSGEIVSRANVVHVTEDPERSDHVIVACRFERMAITDRERIIRYLFFRQRELAGRRKVMTP